MVSSFLFVRSGGQYRIDVAGESFYPELLTALIGPRLDEGVNVEKYAQLTLQDDNPHHKHAVRVTIKGYPVGHLSLEHARLWQDSSVWPAGRA